MGWNIFIKMVIACAFMEWIWFALLTVVFFSISHLVTKRAAEKIEASYLNFLIYLFQAMMALILILVLDHGAVSSIPVIFVT